MTTPENSSEESKQSAQERLNEYLAGETLGSVKYSALVDCAEYMRLMGDFQDDHKHGKEEHDPLVVARWAAVTETIRTRRFGQDGHEYNSAFKEASNIIVGLGLEVPFRNAATYGEHDSDWRVGANHVLATVIGSEDLHQTINV